MKKVLLTGATGLIGRATVNALTNAGFEVYALTRFAPTVKKSRAQWVIGDLFSAVSVREICEKIRADYCLHLAWFTGEAYQFSNINYEYVEASLRLLREFQRCGGKRFIGAGTCFEYKIPTPNTEQNAEKLTEQSPLELTTPYEKCKHHWRELADSFCADNQISFGWGRIFYVYGAGENPQRLGGKMLRNFPRGETVAISPPNFVFDYLYVQDVAAAFAAFLTSAATGNVNICSGRGITLADFAGHYARALNAEKLLVLMEPKNPPKIIIGDNTRLREEIGFSPHYSYEQAIAEIIAKSDLTNPGGHGENFTALA